MCAGQADHRRHGDDTAQSDWARKYGERHRLVRVDLPDGVDAPKKVRIYQRRDHYVLQWWDPGAKKNLVDRVDGDLVDVIARAREIDERIKNFRASGHVSRRLGHTDLMTGYLGDLGRRADAGEITPGTVERYRAALGHCEAFLVQPGIISRYAYAAGVDRDFALEFAAFLNARNVTPNGDPRARARPMKGQGFVLDAVRGMCEWAADPERGSLLPDGFRDPFLGASRRLGTPADDTEEEPDITTGMAIDFISACDAYQLRLFAPVIFYGLRPGEPCFLFHEHVGVESLRVECIPGLLYTTKGKRTKALPLIDAVRPLMVPPPGVSRGGPLFLRRQVLTGRDEAPLRAVPIEKIAERFAHRCAEAGVSRAKDKLRIRGQVMRDAGGITYTTVQREFTNVAGKLGWPRGATAKDFRHLFATTMENGGVPEHYRKYLMGHSRGKAAIVKYTHLNKVRARYEAAVEREWPELVDALERRTRELGIPRMSRNSA